MDPEVQVHWNTVTKISCDVTTEGVRLSFLRHRGKLIVTSRSYASSDTSPSVSPRAYRAAAEEAEEAMRRGFIPEPF